MATTPDTSATRTNPPISPPGFLARMQVAFAHLPNQQKLLLIIALSLVITVAVGGWQYSTQANFKVLFSNLSERDGGSIITALDQMNVPYKFTEGGGAVLVPGDKVHEIRLRLATQGLPKGGSVGFELMENQKFGTSQFTEQINYQRALEGELARTIRSVAAVQEARVHLAIPKPSVFVSKEQKPSASVLLHMYPGRHLEPVQVEGITHLVASSIPMLTASGITIIDQNGALISQLRGSQNGAGLDPTQLKYVREIENGVINRVESILQPITGYGNVRVQVSADVDFSQSEQTAETFKPNTDPTNGAIRSQQSSEHASASPNPIGVPGALTNQPPVPATAPLTAPTTQGAGTGVTNAQGSVASAGINAQITSVGQPVSSRKDSTTNYEVDKTITHTKNQSGRINRLSVAVVVNNKTDLGKNGKATNRNLNEAELKQLNDLAKEAMGFSQQRGDSLSVVNSPFSVTPEEAPLSFWESPDLFDLITELARYLLIGGIIAYLLLGIVRPIMREMLAYSPPTPPPPPNAEGGRRMEGITPAYEEEENVELNMALASFDNKLAKARQAATEDPVAVANILKDWMSANG